MTTSPIKPAAECSPGLTRRAAILLPIGLAGCTTITNLLTPADKRLPGVRENVLPVRNGLELDAASNTTVVLPAPVAIDSWPQPGGNASHVLGSLVGPTSFQKKWQADIGTGNGYRRKLVVQPIIFGGRVFTMDVDGVVSALKAKNGGFLWLYDPAPQQADSTNFGGGLSTDGTYLFVTTGYGDLIALDPAKGKPVWRIALGAPARSAATVQDGVLYLITLDARLLAYSAANGAAIWSYQGETATTMALSVSAPAVEGNFVAAAFGSGELVAVDRQTGVEVWTDSVSTARQLVAASDISTVTSPVVLSGGTVFALGLSGLMLAIDVKSGRRLWERDVGGFQMPWVVGGIVFVYGDGHLLALTRDEGTALWIVEIPQYRNPKKLSGRINWYGPLYFGEKLWMASDTGLMLAIDPANGKFGKPVQLGGKVALTPVIADGTIYIMFESAAIAAFA